MYCACGFSCGTQAAWDRHLAKVALEGKDVGDHELVSSPSAASSKVRTRSLRHVNSLVAVSATQEESVESSVATTRSSEPPSCRSPRIEATSSARRPPEKPNSRSVKSPRGETSAEIAERDRKGIAAVELPSLRSLNCDDDGMFRCSCGFSCGTSKAMLRHLQVCTSSNESVASTASTATPPSTTRSSFSKASSRNEPAANLQPIYAWQRKMSGSEPAFRLILVRHGQSANRRRAPGQPASKDPGLTELGLQQADKVGGRFASMGLGYRTPKTASLLVCSPMHRCLLTIHPTVRRMAWGPEHCICHGGCFEFGCAGLDFPGTSWTDVARKFPEFTPVRFNKEGRWDYQGSNAKETEEEFKARGTRILEWMFDDAMTALRLQRNADPGIPTLILCMHQTLADLLSHFLTEGSAERWSYGDVRYKMDNAGLSTMLVHSDGHATWEQRNAVSHLLW